MKTVFKILRSSTLKILHALGNITLPTLIIGFLMVGVGEGCAQNATIDSLNRVLKSAKEDIAKAEILIQLSEYAGFQSNNYDTAMYYAQSAFELAEKLGDKKGIAKALNNIGRGYSYQNNCTEALHKYGEALKINEEIGYNRGRAANYNNIGNAFLSLNNYPEALQNFSASLKIFEEIGDKVEIAGIYNNIGVVYKNEGNYSEALKNLFEALAINEEIGNKRIIANSYNNIGAVFVEMGNYPEALKNQFAALQLNEKIGDKNGVASNYNNIGLIYANQGNAPEALSNFMEALRINEQIADKFKLAANYNNIGVTYMYEMNYIEALKNLNASLQIRKEIEDMNGIASNYNNIGFIYTALGNYEEALKNLFASLEIREAIVDKKGIASCYLDIGNVYTKLDKPQEGKEWILKGIALCKEIGVKDFTKYGYSYLVSADSALGNFEEAFENYKLYTIYKDSLFNEENTKKITQSAMQYEFDKKQLADSLKTVQSQKLAAQKLKKQKAYTGMGGVLVFLLLGFSIAIVKNNKKLSAEKRKSESLLHNILPAEISAELKERGAATAREFDHVTVLFTDFMNFTIAGERMSSRELVEELHHCFKAFDEIIGKYHIEKIKTVGDAYLAVSGLPLPNPHHAQDVVAAGIEIRDFMRNRKAEWANKTFEIRIGIHSGSVVAGIVGVKKFAYDIWGDTVNTAARMEQSSEAGKVNVSEMTYELIKNNFHCTYRGMIEAKNKGKINMYFVDAEKT